MSKDAVVIDEATKKEVVRQLKESNLLKFGDFILRSGKKSSYYLDLRMATMEPIYEILVEIIGKMVQHCIKTRPQGENSPVAIIGEPYGAVPIAASVAQAQHLKYYPVRREVKNYGVQTPSDLYSEYQFILIEDTMTTGGSVLETLRKLTHKKVTDLIVIADRQEGGEQAIKSEFPQVPQSGKGKLNLF